MRISDWSSDVCSSDLQGRKKRVLLEADLQEQVVAQMVSLAPLKLLDLRTSGASRLGIPTDAVRGRAQQAGRKFSKQLYDRTDFDGIAYMSRITNAECVAIYRSEEHTSELQ